MSPFLSSVYFFLAQAGAASPVPTGAAAPGQPAPQSMLGGLVPFLFMGVIFYFVLIRPQQKKAKELRALLDSIQQNDRVITNGGIHGVVTQVKERTVIIRVWEGVKMEFEKSAITTVSKRDASSPAETAKA